MSRCPSTRSRRATTFLPRACQSPRSIRAPLRWCRGIERRSTDLWGVGRAKGCSVIVWRWATRPIAPTSPRYSRSCLAASAGSSRVPTEIPMVSTVSGKLIEGTELDSGYWCQNLRQPVRLDRALDVLLARGCDVFIEVSAHPVLAIPLTTASAERRGVVVGSLERGAGQLANLYRTLGVLHAHGQAVDWDALLQARPRRLVPLPTYPFQRQRYWLESSSPEAREPDKSDSSLWDAVTALDAVAFADLLKLPETERSGLPGLLPFLSAWHAEAEASATLDHWRYDEAWQALEQMTGGSHTSASNESGLHSCWWVSEDGDADVGSSEALERALVAQGASVVRLTRLEALARLKTSFCTRAARGREPLADIDRVYARAAGALLLRSFIGGKLLGAHRCGADAAAGARRRPARRTPLAGHSACLPHPSNGRAEERFVTKSLGVWGAPSVWKSRNSSQVCLTCPIHRWNRRCSSGLPPSCFVDHRLKRAMNSPRERERSGSEGSSGPLSRKRRLNGDRAAPHSSQVARGRWAGSWRGGWRRTARRTLC